MPFIFTFAKSLQHGEAGFLGVADGCRFQNLGGVEARDDFAHRRFAKRALDQLRRTDRSAKRKLAAADLAVALATFKLVKRHAAKFRRRAPKSILR